MPHPFYGRRTVHVLIPYTTDAACGQKGFSANAMCREDVNCKHCKKTDWYKKLPNRKRYADKRSK
jgi:hypothetical protein